MRCSFMYMEFVIYDSDTCIYHIAHVCVYTIIYRYINGNRSGGIVDVRVGRKWGERDNDNVRSALAGGLL